MKNSLQLILAYHAFELINVTRKKYIGNSFYWRAFNQTKSTEKITSYYQFAKCNFYNLEPLKIPRYHYAEKSITKMFNVCLS